MPQLEVRETPVETLSFLMPSRYCDVDSELLDFAWRTFCRTPTGWPRVQAICDFVQAHLCFDYQATHANRTGLDAFRERGRRLPRFYPSGDCLVPLPEYSGAIRHGLSR